MKTLMVFTLVALGFGSPCLAAEPQGAPPDAQDVLFLNPDGVLIVRLHIMRDGHGYQAAWGDFLWEMFEGLDADGDFTLDYREFQRGRWSQFRRRRADTGFPTGEEIKFLDFDMSPSDDRVSFSEMVETLAQCCCQVSYNPQITQRPSGGEDDALFAQLDRNDNDQLDADETSKMISHLRWLDQNDDELFTAIELSPRASPLRNVFAVGGGRVAGQGQAISPVIAPPPGTAAEAYAVHVLKFYDQQEEKPPTDAAAAKLSPEEFKLPKVQFDRFDSNADGQLDLQELATWLGQRAPDVVLAVRLDADMKAEERLQIASSPPDNQMPQLDVRQAPNGEVQLTLPTTQVVVSARGPTDMNQLTNSYRQMFKRADGDNNDYLDPDEATRIGIRDEFNRIDADRNQQVFLDELLEYRQRQARTAAERNDVQIANRGSTLFEMLDSSSDGRLSVRELRRLGELADTWDRDADAAISKAEVPRRYQLMIRPGSPGGGGAYASFAVATNTFASRQNRPPQGEGPNWFVRMDRNGDGDLSTREFLGPPDDFLRLDADADGLLSPQEAALLTAE